MSWIRVISYKEAKGKLKKLYDRVKGANNNVDNIMLAHSLRPHSMEGHMVLYKSVLHHSENTLPKWFLETIGVYVSSLNKCDYCVQHHLTGLEKLIEDKTKFNEIVLNLKSDFFCKIFDIKYEKALFYAKLLTINPSEVDKDSFEELIEIGFEEGEVLEINQVVAYFNYANRTVLGLGVNTQDDILGLSPNDSSNVNNWNHQ